MRRRGFSFIELMTVFAIIAILAAILFPVFARAREKGRQTNCAGNLMNIGTALRIYAADWYGHLPPTDNDLRPLFPRVLSEPEVLRCPSASGLGPPMAPIRPNPGAAESDYVYRGGLQDDDLPGEAIASDNDESRHNNGANYLFLSGRAKWLVDYSARGKPSEVPGYEELVRLRGGEPATDSPAEPGMPPEMPE
jgi:prepilin-type N-terminal cleavage/methylation domain-containing protein